MKKIIILSFLIVVVLVFIDYFVFENTKDANKIIDQPTLNSAIETSPNLECVTDNDCKLIYSNCSCVSMPLDDSSLIENDPRVDFLEREKDKICKWNICHGTNVTAICKNNKCVRSDLKE